MSTDPAQPHPSTSWEDEGLPDQGLEPEQVATGQFGGVQEPPHDSPLAVEGFGTTPAEQREGEDLAGRLAREQPEVGGSIDTSETPGRLVAPDEGVREDTDKDMVAREGATDQGGLTAEEAAMHVEGEP